MTPAGGGHSPLIARFPALARIPRVALGRYPTPVERVPGMEEPFWVKRDDLGADDVGGNKVRALEFLLASVREGDQVITVGARGSTHAHATAVHARRLGARSTVVRWAQTMNDDTRRTARALERTARVIDVLTPLEAMAVATVLRMRRRTRWVPAGGTSPLGILGHVDAGLELAAQVSRRELPPPARVVVPLGTGGTAAGLALGFAIAGLETSVVGVRVVPRIVARRRRVLALARRTAALIARHGGGPIPLPPRGRIRIVHEEYGGGYGRATASGARAAQRLHAALDIPLDATYSAKAFAGALASHGAGPTLFWLTFDGRWMHRMPVTEAHDRAVR